MLAILVGNEIFQVLGTVAGTGMPSGVTETTTVSAIAAAGINLLPFRIVEDAGNVQVTTFDYDIIIDKTISEDTTVFAPPDPFQGFTFRLKDGNGSSVSNPITLDGNGFLIDGSPTIILNTGYEALELRFFGDQYSIMAAYSSGVIPPGTNFITDELGNKLTDESGNRLVTG